MDVTQTIGDMNQTQDANQSNDESPVVATSLNSDAPPFVPSDSSGISGSGDSQTQTYGTFTLKVPLDSKIWRSISASTPQNHRILSKKLSVPPVPLPINFISAANNHNLMTDVSSEGLICIRRQDNIFIDISLDGAIRVACPTQKILICVSAMATNIVIYHPNGRIFQSQSHVDVVAFDGTYQNNLVRYAKFWTKGISFMARDIPVVYLVDEGGLRSSIDNFVHIRNDYAMEVFNSRSVRHGSCAFVDAVNMMQKSTHTLRNSSEIFEINQIRIISNSDGTISIDRPTKSITIRINPRKGGIAVTSFHIHATASMGKSPHLFLRQGDRRLHFDGTVFCVRNGGYSAGFDERNQVTIFNKKVTLPHMNL
ncbi:uncharacterized protein LOC116336946 [Contarinia nasturtii]|uniref:uncharacterized protein LOC116336946 n=1 Tax=Contarinia nasturtii TaxID=265458 RepID=UPI0012D3EE28|nr:uncharacterized protein LOC116336946 [Contarinia nasturtii]